MMVCFLSIHTFCCQNAYCPRFYRLYRTQYITFASASKLNLPKIVRHEQNKLWAKPILGQSEEKSIVYFSFVCIIYTLQAVVLQSRPRLAYSDRFLALLRKIYSVFFFHTLQFAQMRNVLFTS